MVGYEKEGNVIKNIAADLITSVISDRMSSMITKRHFCACGAEASLQPSYGMILTLTM